MSNASFLSARSKTSSTARSMARKMTDASGGCFFIAPAGRLRADNPNRRDTSGRAAYAEGMAKRVRPLVYF